MRIANDSELGLSGAVFTADDAHGFEIARRMRTGTFSVNTFAADLGSPFGGYKKSGIGREHGPTAYQEFLHYKTISVDPSRQLPESVTAGVRRGTGPGHRAPERIGAGSSGAGVDRWKTATRTSSRRSGWVVSTCGTGSSRCRRGPAWWRAASRPTADVEHFERLAQGGVGLVIARRHGRPPHVRAAVGQAGRGLPGRRRARHEGEGGRRASPRCPPRRAAGPPRSRVHRRRVRPAADGAVTDQDGARRLPAARAHRRGDRRRSSRAGGSPRRTSSRPVSTAWRSTPRTATWPASSCRR